MKFRFTLVLFILSMLIVPATFAQNTCSSDGTLEEFTTTFVNDSATDITVHWLDTNCVEAEGTPIAAGESLEITTYDGHEFVFRNPDGDALFSYMVNTLIADGSTSIKQAISEGAAALVMWESFNPAREELGFEPLYFSDALYNIAQEAVTQFEADSEAAGVDIDAITSGDDLAPLSDALDAIAADGDTGVIAFLIGVSGGSLASTESVAAVMTASVEETEEGESWLNGEAQSFAVYADEHVYIYIFSSMSQPDLDSMLEVTAEPSA